MGYDFDPVDVPAKDSTDDAMMRDVAGKKDDTAQTTVGTTRSLMAYLKGVLNQIATVIAKTDLLNSAVGTSTLNDANVSDTIVPSSLPMISLSKSKSAFRERSVLWRTTRSHRTARIQQSTQDQEPDRRQKRDVSTSLTFLCMLVSKCF